MAYKDIPKKITWVEKLTRGWLHPPDSIIGPLKPRPPTPGLHLPPGAYIPDYKIYKVEDYPELVACERQLAARGLKSPWLRQDAWRYDRRIWGNMSWRTYDFIQQGWKYAGPMLLITAIYEYFKSPEEHHGDGHGHDEHGETAAHH